MLSRGREPQDLSCAGYTSSKDVCVCVISPRHWHFQVLESSKGAEARTLLQPLIVTTSVSSSWPSPPHLWIHILLCWPISVLIYLLTHLSPASFAQSVIHSSPQPEPFCSSWALCHGLTPTISFTCFSQWLLSPQPPCPSFTTPVAESTFLSFAFA